MPDYETLDPGFYEGRFNRVAREGYLNAHWRPRIVSTINRYCRDKRVLDLGCGYGNYTRTVAGARFLVGLDLSEHWLGYARNALGLKELVRANALNVPLRNATLDVVVTIGLLEFVDAEVAIGEIARVLVPGGYCIIESSNKYSAFRLVLRGLLWILGRPYDRREPSYRQVVSALSHHGIADIETWMDDGLIWLPDWLDRRIGKCMYLLMERILAANGRNPCSNVMLLVGRKRIA